MSLEYAEYIPKDGQNIVEPDSNYFQENYNKKRIAIALECKRFKQVVAFQAIIGKYPADALEAMFNLVQQFLKNELMNAKNDRHAEIVSMIEFFKYTNYSQSQKWWEELYGAHLMSGVLEEIITLVGN